MAREKNFLLLNLLGSICLPLVFILRNCLFQRVTQVVLATNDSCR